MNNLDQELDMILEKIHCCGQMGTLNMEDEEDLATAKNTIRHLITTQKQELLSEIEKELPEERGFGDIQKGIVANYTRHDNGDTVKGWNNALDAVKSIITNKMKDD